LDNALLSVFIFKPHSSVKMKKLKEERMQQTLDSLKGQLLTAMPELKDPNFAKSVICVCEQTNVGAMGIVINRIHPGVTGKDLFKELKLDYEPEIGEIPIHVGGPVHLGQVFIMHGPPFGWEGCLRISDTLALSSTIDVLAALALGRGPRAYMVILGCAGWGPGQLEAEILENIWLTAPMSESLLFRWPVNERWDQVMRMMGIDPALLTGTAGHA
jgi:putative transcriptional regulator